MTDQIEGRLEVEAADRTMLRFGIEILDIDPAEATSVMSMPIAGMRNPFTGDNTLGPLAILVDSASGMVNHMGRSDDEWSVSSELVLELSPDAGVQASWDAKHPVVAHARLVGARSSSSLSLCSLKCGNTTIGSGLVRSYFVPGERVIPANPPETLARTAQTEVSDLMAVEIAAAAGDMPVLSQRADPILNNGVGTVHGGVAAAGLELVASAAINTTGGQERSDPGTNTGVRFRTASVRVNFLRPFFAGAHSRYEAAPLRIGRGTAVADAQAVNEDGKMALIARVTAYR
jgi:uncharacterized protein (TIGR00369 family)